jgi:hypothetical protein
MDSGIQQLTFDFRTDFMTGNKIPSASPPSPVSGAETGRLPEHGGREEISPEKEEFPFEPVRSDTLIDYTVFPANRIFLAGEKSILDNERPPYIPPFTIEYMRSNYFIPPLVKVKNDYFIKTEDNPKRSYKLSLDGLAATIDYYTKYQRALNTREIQKNENPEGWHSLKPKKVRFLSVNRMTHNQMLLLKESGLGTEESWNTYREVREALEQKMADLCCQMEDLQSVYTKGAETSYGDKKTNPALKERYGVLVKRQNGDTISGHEIREIEEALEKTTKVFGSLREVSSGYGLKISHSGSKNMHARKAIGIFTSHYKAIGVCFANTETGYLILAHELSHFLDALAGKEPRHFFASDKTDTPENRVAKTFRSLMNKDTPRTQDSKYLNRTCECFARAMEQYTAFILSPAQYEIFTKSEAYARDEPFRKEIIPLIDTVLQERYPLWHGKEASMEIDTKAFQELEKEARRITADYKPSVDLKTMTVESLTGFIRLAEKRKQEFAEEIKKAGEGQKTPEQTLRLLVESRRGALFQSFLEKEYAGRLERQNKPLKTAGTEPVTAENFKRKFMRKMADPEAGNNVIHALRLLMKEIRAGDREKINRYLDSQGFKNPATAVAMLDIWAKDAKTIPAKTKDREYTGR